MATHRADETPPPDNSPGMQAAKRAADEAKKQADVIDEKTKPAREAIGQKVPCMRDTPHHTPPSAPPHHDGIPAMSPCGAARPERAHPDLGLCVGGQVGEGMGIVGKVVRKVGENPVVQATAEVMMKGTEKILGVADAIDDASERLEKKLKDSSMGQSVGQVGDLPLTTLNHHQSVSVRVHACLCIPAGISASSLPAFPHLDRLTTGYWLWLSEAGTRGGQGHRYRDDGGSAVRGDCVGAAHAQDQGVDIHGAPRHHGRDYG